ncbi:hypothetical protein BKA69DRAFT_1069072 [Paraphysoderma sedebokerense]|nr:hypothetical protein BKA69DRAFT_1069072 [Paraphysoderma sedebokerense]
MSPFYMSDDKYPSPPTFPPYLRPRSTQLWTSFFASFRPQKTLKLFHPDASPNGKMYATTCYSFPPSEASATWRHHSDSRPERHPRHLAVPRTKPYQQHSVFGSHYSSRPTAQHYSGNKQPFIPSIKPYIGFFDLSSRRKDDYPYTTLPSPTGTATSNLSTEEVTRCRTESNHSVQKSGRDRLSIDSLIDPVDSDGHESDSSDFEFYPMVRPNGNSIVSCLPSPPPSRYTSPTNSDAEMNLNGEDTMRKREISSDYTPSLPMDQVSATLHSWPIYQQANEHNVHVKRYNGRQPHSCMTCGRTFRRRHDRDRHMTTHTKEKLHICDCGNRYARSDGLLRHLRKGKCPKGEAIYRTDNIAVSMCFD